jgi:hypothetical protein
MTDHKAVAEGLVGKNPEVEFASPGIRLKHNGTAIMSGASIIDYGYRLRRNCHGTSVATMFIKPSRSYIVLQYSLFLFL